MKLFQEDWPQLTLSEKEAELVGEVYSNAKVILEYGSGGSTVLAANMPGKLIFSVESDRDWALSLQTKFDRNSLPSTAIIYYVNIGPTGAWGRALDDTDWQKFHRYPTAIWTEIFFRQPDVILIDGRFRAACFVAACLRIQRPTVLLFDDYENRHAYHIVESLVKPRRVVGRMAEFHLKPQSWPIWVHDLLIELCTHGTFSKQEKHNYHLEYDIPPLLTDILQRGARRRDYSCETLVALSAWRPFS